VTDRTPIQYAAGSLAASAFVAVTQILAGAAPLDLPLHIALVAFAINIPFQIFLFLISYERISNIEQGRGRRAASQGLSWPARLYSSISLISTPAIMIGFVALFWHFAWWLGVLFAIAAYAAYRIFDYLCL